MADSPNGKTKQTPVLTQSIEVTRNPFVSPLVDSRPEVRVAVHADLTKEYVTSGKLGYYPFFRALPPYNDDISREFGLEIYARMMTDPVVHASTQLVPISILANGYELVPSLSREEPDYDVAVKMRDFVKQSLDQLETPYDTVLEQHLTSFDYGLSVSEQVYYVRDGGLWLRDLRDKPLINTILVVDSFNKTVGIMTQRFPGQAYPAGSYIPIDFSQITQGQNLPKDETTKQGEIDLSKRLPGFLPRDLFSILTNKMRYNDERGASGLRAAYSAWWFKQQVIAEYLAWLSRFASPSLVGTTAQGAKAETVLDENLEPVEDPSTNLPQVTSPEQVMAGQLAQFQNGTAMAIPFGAKVEPIQTSGNGEAFSAAINWANAEIVRAITYQFLATSEGMHNARAASEVHQDILSLGIQRRKRWLAGQQRREVYYRLLRYNFDISGKEIQRYVPHLDLGAGSGFPMSPDTIAKLATAKFIDPSQYERIDKMIGLPQRETIKVDGATLSPNEMLERSDNEMNQQREQENQDRQMTLQEQQAQQQGNQA